MRAAAGAASVVIIAVMWCNVSLGVLGQALYPDLALVDEAFPRILIDSVDGWMAGLVLAGVLAACLSTYDSIGSALGAVLTRDVFCRFLAPHAGERAMLATTRLAAVACIGCSFLYIPFLGEGMVAFYLRLSSVAVVPLATVFAVGALTRAHKGSGTAGMAAGLGCGLASMMGGPIRVGPALMGDQRLVELSVGRGRHRGGNGGLDADERARRFYCLAGTDPRQLPARRALRGGWRGLARAIPRRDGGKDRESANAASPCQARASHHGADRRRCDLLPDRVPVTLRGRVSAPVLPRLLGYNPCLWPA